MAFSIDSFKSNFSDLARTYMFECQFDAGAQLEAADLKVGPVERISYLVESTTLPAKTVTSADANYMGYQVKLASGITYADWTINFRVDTKYRIYHFFNNWMNQIRDKVGNISSPYNSSSGAIGYKKTIWLNQLSEDSSDVNISGSDKKYISRLTLSGAFPSVLGDITYDTKSSDIQIFPVTFVYDFHTWDKFEEKKNQTKIPSPDFTLRG